MYRTIIETSCMLNNDEYVMFTKNPLETKDLPSASSPFSEPRVVISRPVYEAEADEGLDLTYRGSGWDEKAPEITYLLDSYYRLKEYFEFSNKWMSCGPAGAIAHYIASHYYDCMSAGMKGYDAAILKYFCEECRVDLAEKVYPGRNENDKWLTLKDWLVDIGDVPDFRGVLAKLRGKLPNMPPLLTARQTDHGEKEETREKG